MMPTCRWQEAAMEGNATTYANRFRTVWAGLRDFYRAWRALREQRYRYLEEILGDSAPPPASTQRTCDHRL